MPFDCTDSGLATVLLASASTATRRRPALLAWWLVLVRRRHERLLRDLDEPTLSAVGLSRADIDCMTCATKGYARSTPASAVNTSSGA